MNNKDKINAVTAIHFLIIFAITNISALYYYKHYYPIMFLINFAISFVLSAISSAFICHKLGYYDCNIPVRPTTPPPTPMYAAGRKYINYKAKVKWFEDFIEQNGDGNLVKITMPEEFKDNE